MNIGIIGTGNMGTILVESFIESRAVTPSNLYLTNRTLKKAENLKTIDSALHVMPNAEEVAASSDIIFVCIKPLDIFPLLNRLSPLLKPEQCIVSITSPISVEQIQEVVKCNVARVIPSITNRALSGVSLMTFSQSCSQEMKEQLLALFHHISSPVLIEDNITRVASDIVSCGPAFFTYLVRRFITSAVEETEISEEIATELASGMIIGLGKLLDKGVFTLPTLQEKVCVKGGVTGEGIKVLEEELGLVFNHVFNSTHEKYYEDIREVTEQLECIRDIKSTK
ncbi:late competence protein ComER [Bacillus suaedaesalsae]|uniref:Late competence protein ComER n=1 Tax=Bacillus suaedaesalsae TaxID=2810349 RepID=A0ABS2DL70_9BACI|nr:late competence protein ComER [Bacillus suaedaesalsae]MBM6619229.1 late competence protein ComER [Bacillus suaedaesalsae]